MTGEEFYKKLLDINITYNDEKYIDEDNFSSDLRYKDFFITYEKDRLKVSWQPKYWDEDPDEQKAVLDEIESVLVYWAKKLNFTEKLEVFLELTPAVCSEWDAEDDDAYCFNVIYLNG